MVTCCCSCIDVTDETCSYRQDLGCATFRIASHINVQQLFPWSPVLAHLITPLAGTGVWHPHCPWPGELLLALQSPSCPRQPPGAETSASHCLPSPRAQLHHHGTASCEGCYSRETQKHPGKSEGDGGRAREFQRYQRHLER